jgi:hypothetical protein
LEQTVEGGSLCARVAHKRIDNALAAAMVGHQAGVAENGEVARNGVLGQGENGLEVANTDVAVAEKIEESETGGFSGGFEDGGQG